MSDEFEEQLLTSINVFTDWRVPLDGFGIRCLATSYLDKRGIIDSRFRNNMPGPEWLSSFMEGMNLTKRIADNVESSQAEVNLESIKDYFNNLSASSEGVKPENIFN